MKRISVWSLFSVLGLAAVLSLGAPPALARFKADVVRFHGATVPSGQSVALEAADPEQAGSLEFSSYANRLGEGLGRLGFKPAATTDAAPGLIGQIGYATTLRPVLRDGDDSPVHVGVGVGGGGGNVGVSVGTVFGLGKREPRGGARVHELRLVLKTPEGAAVWEGRATTETDERTPFAEVAPGLVDALLSDFPGPSGRTTRYKAPRK